MGFVNLLSSTNRDLGHTAHTPGFRFVMTGYPVVIIHFERDFPLPNTQLLGQPRWKSPCGMVEIQHGCHPPPGFPTPSVGPSSHIAWRESCRASLALKGDNKPKSGRTIQLSRVATKSHLIMGAVIGCLWLRLGFGALVMEQWDRPGRPNRQQGQTYDLFYFSQGQEGQTLCCARFLAIELLTCIHAYIHTYIYIRYVPQICCVYIHVCVYIYTSVCIHTYVYTVCSTNMLCLYTCVCIYIYTYIYIYIYGMFHKYVVFIYMCMYIYICI